MSGGRGEETKCSGGGKGKKSNYYGVTIKKVGRARGRRKRRGEMSEGQ